MEATRQQSRKRAILLLVRRICSEWRRQTVLDLYWSRSRAEVAKLIVTRPQGKPIASARSSDTDMTDCSTVLQGGGAACQC